MGKSNIEWTDRTWNPTRGCTRASPGCESCYAEAHAHRFSGPGQPYEGLVHVVGGHPQWTGEVRLVPEKLDEPLKWREPSVIFVDSMADLFHEKVPDGYLDRVFETVLLAPRHFFLVLTKRAERLWYYFSRWSKRRIFPPNLGLGVSVENQDWASERLPYLMMLKGAALRFVSYEPALGPVNFQRLPVGFAEPIPDALGQIFPCRREVYPLDGMFAIPDSDWEVGKIDWLIVGGESDQGGRKARPFHLEWARQAVAQCAEHRTAVFVKQLGSNAVDVFSPHYDPAGEPLNLKLPLKNRKGGDMGEWVSGLRVRQYPRVMEEWRERTTKAER